MTATYHAVFYKAEEGGFWAEVLELPGCVAQGESLDELTRSIADAIDVFLETMEEEGEQPIRDRLIGTLEVASTAV